MIRYLRQPGRAISSTRASTCLLQSVTWRAAAISLRKLWLAVSDEDNDRSIYEALKSVTP